LARSIQRVIGATLGPDLVAVRTAHRTRGGGLADPHHAADSGERVDLVGDAPRTELRILVTKKKPRKRGRPRKRT
jgi:hypothetical protein